MDEKWMRTGWDGFGLLDGWRFLPLSLPKETCRVSSLPPSFSSETPTLCCSNPRSFKPFRNLILQNYCNYFDYVHFWRDWLHSRRRNWQTGEAVFLVFCVSLESRYLAFVMGWAQSCKIFEVCQSVKELFAHVSEQSFRPLFRPQW